MSREELPKEIILISIIIALIAISPFILTLPKVSALKGQYIPKWSEISPIERQELYGKVLETNFILNNLLKLLLEIGAVIVVLLVIVEYIKFHKLHKEE